MSKTLSELHNEFLRECRHVSRLRKETVLGYEHAFRLFNLLVPNVTVDMLNSGLITTFFERLETRTRIDSGGTKRVGVKTSTVATYRSKLNSFFKWLKNKNLIEENPFKGMKYPKVEYDDLKYLKREQIEKICSTVTLNKWHSELVAKRNVAIFHTLLFTGIRRGELLGLKVADVDFKRRELTIRGETSKSRRKRVLPMNSRVMIALQDYTDVRGKNGFVNPYLFISQSGDTPLTRDGLKHLVDKVKKISGVKFHLHQFRHTFAVNLLKNGVNFAKIKILLGHTDIRMTQRYLRALPTGMMQSDVEQLDIDKLA